MDTTILLAKTVCALVRNQPDALRHHLERAQKKNISYDKVYEAILQSYLFDGYPTALEGLRMLDEVWNEPSKQSKNPHEFTHWQEWRKRGLHLYEIIYGKAGGKLWNNASNFAPDLAEWMIVEGYGKVLSRDGLDLITRECCIVAMLMVKRRDRQLFSHLRGAVRSGASFDLLRSMIAQLHQEYDEISENPALTYLGQLQKAH